MFGSFLQPDDEQVCYDDDRMLDFQLRVEVASFDVQLAAFLASPQGRFEAFYAERARQLAA